MALPTPLSGKPRPSVKISLRLQAAFGLRCEESIKLQPRYADRGDHIAIKGS